MYYVQTDHNVKLAVNDYDASSSRTVLFLHGWAADSRIFEYQLNVLPQIGYRTVTMDFRGFGKSDCPSSGYSYDQLARDVYRVISSLNVRSVTLVGYCLGAAVAVRYMNLFQGYKVGKLALLSAPVPLYTRRKDFRFGKTIAEVDDLLDRLYRDRPAALSAYIPRLFYQTPSREFVQWMIDLSLSQNGLALIETLKTMRDEDLRPELRNIHVKTGIFHGLKDQCCSFELTDVMHTCIKNSEIFAFDHSGHALFYDELDQFNQGLLAFLEN